MMTFKSPKNFKKGRYVLNKYRWKDLVILVAISITCIGGIVLFMNGFITDNWIINVSIIGVFLLPIGIAYVFVTPMPVYFNVFDFMVASIQFSSKQKRFKWEGIHVTSEDDYFEHEEGDEQSEKTQPEKSTQE